MITDEKRIPENSPNFIKIRKSDWSNSVDVVIEKGFDFNVLDLFFIFRFYFKNPNCFIRSLYLCINTKEDTHTLFTYKKIFHYGLEKYKIDGFIKWLNDILDKDKEYILESNFYGFRISFHEFSPILTNNKILPEYPWKDPYYNDIEEIKNLKYIDLI